MYVFGGYTDQNHNDTFQYHFGTCPHARTHAHPLYIPRDGPLPHDVVQRFQIRGSGRSSSARAKCPTSDRATTR
jgi:hypothetical protein